MVGAVATIAGTVATTLVGSVAIILSLNPEWIADEKLLRRVEKNGRLKDVCLSICLSKCGTLVIESDLAPCILVQSKVERLGLVVKSHLYVAHSYHAEVEQLLIVGLLRRLEDSAVAQFSTSAHAGYQITGEWLRLSEKMEDRLVRYRVGENLFSRYGAFIDDYMTEKVNSLYLREILCDFPGIELRADESQVIVIFVPMPQVRNREYAVAFFPEHGYSFRRGSRVAFRPMMRPVNLGEAQFNNLQGRLSASIESVEEVISRDGQPYTRVGLCYTNGVFNA